MSGDKVGGDRIYGDKVGGDKIDGDKFVQGKEVRMVRKPDLGKRERAESIVAELDRALSILEPVKNSILKAGLRPDVVDEITTAYWKLKQGW